jgi:hypothetical protein
MPALPLSTRGPRRLSQHAGPAAAHPARETTDQSVTMIYQAILPPPGATCDTTRCATTATVRVLIPRSRFDAAGAHQARDTWDSCDLHWPGFRETAARSGHRVTDTTGDPQRLPREFPAWRIFRSDLGRLYACRPGTTVYGWLTAQLRAEIRKCRADGQPRGGS